jgi:hypothetical protein
MRLNIITLACAAALAIGLSFGVGAGPVVDTDGDGVIDELDNCSAVSNSVQCDLDVDGYGNVCDADYSQDMAAGGTDFVTFRALFTKTVGPSGLLCAGSIACGGV